LFPDQSRYQQAFNKYKESLEILFNHEKELASIAGDRRKPPMQPRVADSAYE
jgi:hypothetical protein